MVRYNILRNKKGQGSTLSGDLPVIVMIVIAIAFFLSSLGYAITVFDEGKADLQLKRAAVEAANAFLQESAKINPEDIDVRSEFWQTQLETIQQSQRVNVYVQLFSLDPAYSKCSGDADCTTPSTTCCIAGTPPSEISNRIVTSFPVAIRDTDLLVYPGKISVTIWR